MERKALLNDPLKGCFVKALASALGVVPTEDDLWEREGRMVRGLKKKVIEALSWMERGMGYEEVIRLGEAAIHGIDVASMAMTIGTLRRSDSPLGGRLREVRVSKKNCSLEEVNNLLEEGADVLIQVRIPVRGENGEIINQNHVMHIERRG